MFGSGTQAPLDKANKKFYENHYAGGTYPEHLPDKTKKSQTPCKDFQTKQKAQTFLIISRLDKNQKIWNGKTKTK